MIELLASRYAYALMFALLAVGLYMMIANENLVKKLIGVNLFQTAIFLFFVAVAYVEGGSAPIVEADPDAGAQLVASPLPHVIVLTAIVVGVGFAAMALGGNFLEYDVFYELYGLRQKWGMEAIEVGGIALIVSGVVITLFFATAAGFTPTRTDGSGRGGDDE